MCRSLPAEDVLTGTKIISLLNSDMGSYLSRGSIPTKYELFLLHTR